MHTQFQKAVSNYSKSGNLKPLCSQLIKLVITLAGGARSGHEFKVIDSLPPIVKTLQSVDMSENKQRQKEKKSSRSTRR